MTDKKETAGLGPAVIEAGENAQLHNPPNPLLAQALRYAGRGWAVLPLQPKGKIPLTPHGCNDASKDKEQIAAWWEKHPDANVGIATGAASGFFVVDIDGEEGELSLKKLEELHVPLPPTGEVITGGGGRHLYFKLPDGQSIRNSAGKIADKVDIRGEGGYVVAPPSVHPSGKTYVFSVDTNNKMVQSPDWLVNLICGDSGRPQGGTHHKNPEVILEGKRNEALTELCGHLLGKGLRASVCLDECIKANLQSCQPPLPDHEVRQIVNSIAGRELVKRGGACSPQTDNIAALDKLLEEEEKANQPLPLMRDVPPETAVPIDALDGILRDAVLAIHDKVGAPVATGFQSVLAVATLATQAHANVLMPTQQKRPISDYFMTISESGERKSSADSEAMKPVRMREDELRQEYEAALPNYRDERQAWEKARTDVQNKAAKGNAQAIKAALQAIGPEPQPPLHPFLTCNEPTLEGLYLSLSTGQASQGVFSSEGGQFYGGYSMSKDNKLKTVASLSSLWDGDSVRSPRKGDGISSIENRRLSSHLMMQPGVARLAFGDPVLTDQGFMSRQLAVMPDPLAGTRLWKTPKPKSLAALDAYTQHTLGILRQPYPLQSGKVNELAPRTLVLSDAAASEWKAFYNAVEKDSGSGGRYERIRGLASKLGEHAIRLAAVLTLFDDMNATNVPLEKMQAGIALAQYYAQEALRIAGIAEVDAKVIAANKLLDWVNSSYKGDLITYHHVYKNGCAGFGDAKVTKAAFETLEEHGYLTKLPGKHHIGGANCKDVYRIHGKS